MNKPNYDKVFSKHLVGNIIPGFPYLQKFCPLCEHELKLIRAIHIKEEEYLFKAIYICDNLNCDAFDEAARKAYVRIAYSSPEALLRLEDIPIEFKRPGLIDETSEKSLFDEWF